MEIRPARRDEVEELTVCSKAAFESDALLGNEGGGGPPDYDSVLWHEQMRESGHLYAVLESGQLLGGVILYCEREERVMHVGRLFIHPQHHRKGSGTAAMLELERLFPDIRLWELDTPVWNGRTNRFYTKLGYRETGRDGEFVSYQKG